MSKKIVINFYNFNDGFHRGDLETLARETHALTKGGGKGEGGSCCKRRCPQGGWGGVFLPVEAKFWRFFAFCLKAKFRPKCKNTILKKSRNGSPALALCYEWQKNTKPTNQGSYDFTTFAKHLKTKTSISKNRKS